jgi:hypothetical protein
MEGRGAARAATPTCLPIDGYRTGLRARARGSISGACLGLWANQGGCAMTSRAVSRWLSRQLIYVVRRLSPSKREDWAQAMSREVEEIPGERDALMWALGCVLATCYERFISMKPSSWWPLRWAMAMWIALLATEMFAYSVITLGNKLQLFTEHLPLLEATPLWESVLAVVTAVSFLLAVVLILRRSRAAFGAVVVPCAMMLLGFAIRVSRPESGILQSLSMAYHRSHYFLTWPVVALAMTMLICLTLWHDRRAPAPH